MPRSQFHVPDLKLIEEKILTVKDYRAYVTPMKSGSSQADNKWMGTLKCSSMACMKLGGHPLHNNFERPHDRFAAERQGSEPIGTVGD